MTTEQFLKVLDDAINKRVDKLNSSHAGYMEGDKIAGIAKGRDLVEIAHLKGLQELINGFKPSHPVS